MSIEGQDIDNVLLNAEERALQDAKKLYESNTENLRLLDRYIQLLIKNNQIGQAQNWIDSSSLLKKDCADARSVHAHLIYKMKDYEKADTLFDDLLIQYPDNDKLRLLYANTLRKRKKIIKAYKVVSPVHEEALDKKQRIIYDEIIQIYSLIEEKELRPLDDGDDFGILSMKHAILYFKDYPERKLNPVELGKVSLITGSLGPGGAEKQLCLTAIHLNKKMKAAETIAGVKITKEADVLINVYDIEDKGFFLNFLKEHQINPLQIKDLPQTPIERLSIQSPSLLNLVNESPSSIRYGLIRLVDYFRAAKTEVAFVWQDGAILFTALAALVAGVPKIVLNLRGYPPNLRPQIFKPEYYELYKALAQLSRVSFITNTEATAKAYADWLSIPKEKFSVIYNGITSPSMEPEDHNHDLWHHFERQTGEATETVGGVFRFETDKRPFIVIRFIKRYLHKYPKARFILVGEGRMRKQCMTLAEELKISQRILFVGLSKSVGYWMHKMDAMILMSLYEGLPNVLIEAQYMGLPVISTPAGGAKECYIEGETGFSLNNLQDPDLYEACDKVAELIARFRKNPSLRKKASDFAAHHFSISGMIEKTVKSLCGNRISQSEPLLCKDVL